MAYTVTFNGVGYTVPSPGDSNDWGAALNAFFTAIGARFPGTSLSATGTVSASPLVLAPQAQPTGPNAIGDFYVSTVGVLYVCTVAGTPGTWTAVGSQGGGSGVTTLAAVGASPNANGGTIAGSTLNLQAASQAFPGAMVALDKFKLDTIAPTVTAFQVTTPSDTPTVIATIPVPTGKVITVKLEMMVVTASGAAPSGGSARWRTFRNVGGTAFLCGSGTSVYTNRSSSAWDGDVDPVGGNAVVTLNGITGQSAAWTVWITTFGTP